MRRQQSKILSLLLFAAALLAAPQVHAVPDKGLIKARAPRAHSPLRYPVILAHGFNASPQSSWGFSDKVVNQLKRQLGSDQVFVAQVNPYASSQTRGAELNRLVDQVLAQTGAEKVHIVAHSQGGKDSVFLTSPQGAKAGNKVKSVTTIQTPHKGTFVSNAVLDGFSKNEQGQAVPRSNLSKKLLKGISGLMKLALNDKAESYPADMLAAHQTMFESRPGQENHFNEQYPLDDRVVYASWAGLSNVLRLPNLFHDARVANVAQDGKPLANPRWATPFRWYNLRHWMSVPLTAIAPIVAKGLNLKANDGVVPTESAKGFDRFIFRGTLPIDHMGAVGQGRGAGVDRWTGFSPEKLYSTIVNDLQLIEKGGEKLLIQEGRAWHEAQ